MADTNENPRRRTQGPRRGRMERRSTGAQKGADGAPGQRDAGSVVGTTSSVGQNEKPDKMLKWNGVLCRSAGGVRRAAVRSRAALPGAPAGILSTAS